MVSGPIARSPDSKAMRFRVDWLCAAITATSTIIQGGHGELYPYSVND